nr:hypothetical protein [Tanacetum cinerariifolium]
MTSFDYRLNPLYPIKECSSCGALYTTNFCCSEGILGDKIICDLDKTPDLSQQSHQNCPKCGNPVDGHYCQGCALFRKKFKEDLFISCVENEILPDSSEPSNDDTNVANALQEPFLKVLIIPNPKSFNDQSIKELPPTVPSFDPSCYSEDGNSFIYDSTSNLVYDSLNVFDPPPQPLSILVNSAGTMLLMKQLTSMCDMVGQFIQKKEEKQIKEEQVANARYWKIPACYDDDNDDDDNNFAITPKEPDNSLSMGDEHLDTVPTTKSNEFIKSSVENLVPNPSEPEGEYERDVPAYEVFTTFLNILFDSDYAFYSVDDQLFSDEDSPKKIYLNPLFDEEIISMKIDPHHFNAESDLIESLFNHDSSIIPSSSKIDSLFDEFAGKLTLLKSILPGINETDCDPEEETHFIWRLLYGNSYPRPSKEFISENSDAAFESFSPFPIPVEDSDSLMEEIDLSFTPDDPMPPGIKEDDNDSERDILILEELLSNDSLSFLKKESFHFDIPSSSRPPEKSPDLLSHQGHEAFQPSAECPMPFYGKNTPILDVPLFHFYPP